jgi:catechol 2,3-dioxygenase-like lactoylglutathione lyase family enzyme
MKVESLTPILNVSDIPASFAWFAKLGWTEGFTWNDPPTFGSVCNGKVEVFLCKGAQGSRGGPMPRHADDDDTGGVWMSWWLKSPADVDAVHALALREGITVTRPPTNEPWGVRECHLRHPDGHTFRISAGLGKE